MACTFTDACHRVAGGIRWTVLERLGAVHAPVRYAHQVQSRVTPPGEQSERMPTLVAAPAWNHLHTVKRVCGKNGAWSTSIRPMQSSARKAIIDRVGPNLKVATPIGYGQAVLLLNALYSLVEATPHLPLTIFTGLTLTRPHYRTDLERRFMAPLAGRLFATYPEPLYVLCPARKPPATQH
jgi:hypothetical protein